MKTRMRVAVVTPYAGESSDVLQQCIDSVSRQTWPCIHVLVSDGDSQRVSVETEHELISLASRHNDNGNVARAVGSVIAESRHVDAIAYLDADNWFDPEHVETMIALHERTRAPVCTATRTIHHMNGDALYVDIHESDGVRHADTSCLFLTRSAFSVLSVWHKMPRPLSPLCDRVVWSVIRKRGFATAHSPRPSVAFRTRYFVHYRFAGVSPPSGALSNAETTDRARHWWGSLSEGERNAYTAEFMR